MSTRGDQAKNIFLDAIDIADDQERRALVDARCSGDEVLRREVDDLLRHHGELGSFLLQPAIKEESASPDVPPVLEYPGMAVGRYKLLEEIGEGGFGVVYMAEQEEPVRRRVALKVIKPGMDSRQVIARFDAERQALALMDHPNVARVLDAGTTRHGRPFFVMDLIKGIPITEYADEATLSTRERLELFLEVCQGVQHAHQKGIIHRDLKPTNVLVTLHASKALPKIIDFGVAKAIHHRLTERTLYTRFAQMIGTPLYMSPEQAALSDIDLDTRSDIYSLGVLLYELLTGTTPLERGRLGESSYDEIRKTIRETQPPTPSQRLATTKIEALRRISACRRTEPRKAAELLRGDLDWITMKAIEKDRTRRYETVSAFATDVERYLVDEPVEARPPSAWYRFGKFARRNRAGLWIAACWLVAVTAVVGSAGWLVGERAARLGEAERQARGALRHAEAAIASRDWPEARLEVTRAEGLVVRQGIAPVIAARIADLTRDLDMIVHVEDIDVENSEYPSGSDAAAAAKYEAAFEEYGLPIETLGVSAAATRIREGRIALDLAFSLERWAASLRQLDDGERWKHLLSIARQADPDPLRDRVRDFWGQDNARELRKLALTVEIEKLPAFSARVIGRALMMTGSAEQAVSFLQRAQALNPHNFWLNRDLAHSLHHLDRWDEALRFATAAVALRPEDSLARSELATVLAGRGLLDDAILQSREAVRLNPDDAAVRSSLGCNLADKGLLSEAIAQHEEALRLEPNSAWAHSNFGISLAKTGRLEEAIAEFRTALRLDRNFALAHMNLGHALSEKGLDDDAIAAYKAALRLEPTLFDGQFGLGNALEKKGLLDEASVAFRRATRLRPREIRAYGMLGMTLARKGRFDEAIQALRTAVRLEPDSAFSHICLGNALRGKGLIHEAIVEQREAVRLEPDNALSHCNLAGLLSQNRNFDEAIKEFREAIRLDPKCTKAHANLGQAFKDTGRLDEAIEAYRQASRLDTEWACYHHYIGWLLMEKKDLDAAITELERSVRLNPPHDEHFVDLDRAYTRALEVRPNDVTILVALARLLTTCPGEKLRHPARAIKLARKAGELAPQDGRAWSALGMAEYRNGNWNEAIAAIGKSIELSSDGTGFDYFFLAMAHRQMKNEREAREAYDQAVRRMGESEPGNEELRRLRAEAEQLLRPDY